MNTVKMPKQWHRQWPKQWYAPNCRQCPRLVQFLQAVKAQHANYICKPVAPFGAQDAQLLIVGLAPGKHGANASGRPFTGDHAGILLYKTLYKFGFASAAVSAHASDALQLYNCRITNAVKCLPPQNKPLGEEQKNCTGFLQAEMRQPDLRIILALGHLAHRAILRAFNLKLSQYQFAHNTGHTLDNGRLLIDSYHCSRYNTNTGRLSEPMFNDVFQRIHSELAKIARA